MPAHKGTATHTPKSARPTQRVMARSVQKARAFSLQRAVGKGLNASPDELLALQQTYGNRAVVGMLDQTPGATETPAPTAGQAVGVQRAPLAGVIQRTVWRWDGTAWKNEEGTRYASSSAARGPRDGRYPGESWDDTADRYFDSGFGLGPEVYGVRADEDAPSHRDDRRPLLSSGGGSSSIELEDISLGGLGPRRRDGYMPLMDEAEDEPIRGGPRREEARAPRRSDPVATRIYESIVTSSQRTALLGSGYASESLSLRGQCESWLRSYSATGSPEQVRTITGLRDEANHKLAEIRAGRGRRYSFNQNDLLYGHTGDRRRYEPTLDAMNRALQGGGGGGDGGDAMAMMAHPAPLNQPYIADYMNNLFVGTNMGTRYGDRSDPTPDLDPTNPVFRDFRRMYDRYVMNPSIDRGPGGASVRIARACQFGIWLTAKQGRKVRFVLDGIYTARTQRDYATTSTAFTAQELRFTRSTWHDPAIRENVKFYANGREVLPPWDEFSAEWAAFTPENLHLPVQAELEATPDEAVERLANEVNTIMRELGAIVARRGETIARMQELTEQIQVLQRPVGGGGFWSGVKSFFGVGDEVKQMKKNMQKAQNLMLEVNALRDEATRLGLEAQAMNQQMAEKADQLSQIIRAKQAM